jgi:hypothetical protein
MQDRVAIERGEARGPVRHQALALGRAHLLAEVGLGVQAVFALPALGGVERDDMIAGLQRGHALAHLQHDARALMAEDRGEQPLGVRARKREVVGVADAGGLDLDQNLARLRAVEVHVHDFQRFSGFKGHGGTCAHGSVPPSGLFWGAWFNIAVDAMEMTMRIALASCPRCRCCSPPARPHPRSRGRYLRRRRLDVADRPARRCRGRKHLPRADARDRARRCGDDGFPAEPAERDL